MKDTQTYLFEQIEHAFEAEKITATWRSEWANRGVITLFDQATGHTVGDIAVDVQTKTADMKVTDAPGSTIDVRIAFTSNGISRRPEVHDVPSGVDTIVKHVMGGLGG